MKDLAPEILRQRLLIEGRYSIDVDQYCVGEYLKGVAAHLELRAYGEPMIHTPDGMGKQENSGYDAFIPLIDSGISLYVWSEARFFSVVLFTCKHFDTAAAVQFTTQYFQASAIEHAPF